MHSFLILLDWSYNCCVRIVVSLIVLDNQYESDPRLLRSQLTSKIYIIEFSSADHSTFNVYDSSPVYKKAPLGLNSLRGALTIQKSIYSLFCMPHIYSSFLYTRFLYNNSKINSCIAITSSRTFHLTMPPGSFYWEPSDGGSQRCSTRFSLSRYPSGLPPLLVSVARQVYHYPTTVLAPLPFCIWQIGSTAALERIMTAQPLSVKPRQHVNLPMDKISGCFLLSVTSK